MKKEMKGKYLSVLIFLIVVVVLGFVFAGDITSIYINNQASSSVYNSNLLNRFFNFTVMAGTGDINQTNFSVSTGLSIVPATNGTNAFGSILNDSKNISWTNMTGDQTFIINANSNKSFWFNISAAVDGYYNVTVITWNVTDGVNKTNVTLLFDTRVESITIMDPVNTSGFVYNTTNTTLHINFTVSDGNGVGLSACWYTNDTRGANVTLTNCGTNITITWAQGNHNLTIWANDTLNNVNSTSVNFTVDNVGPVLTFVTPINGTSIANGIYTLNATVVDASLGVITAYSVYFNMTNLTGRVQNETFINATPRGNYYYNSTSFNASKYAEGRYIIELFANDTLGNGNRVNSTIYIDRTAPTTITLTYQNLTRTTIDFNISIVDALSPINLGCMVNRSGTIVTPEGTREYQNVSDTSLTCATAYTYNVSCNDSAGNANSTTISLTTSDCEVVSTGGSSSATNVLDNDLSQGYTKNYYLGEVLIFKSNGARHTFLVVNMKNSSITIQVSSKIQRAILALGEEKKFDLNNDSFYDISVKFNGVIGTKADVTLKTINESMITAIDTTTGTTSITDTAAGTSDEPVAEADTGSQSKIWWIVGIVIVIVIIVLLVIRRKK
jgi:hypothetical protein